MSNMPSTHRHRGEHNGARPFRVEKRGERRPFKPPAWSHQKDLEALKGKKVALMLMNSSQPTIGILDEADAFTIKVAGQTYFKHALLGFAPT